MEERGNPAGLRQAPTGEEEVSREGGRRQGLRYGCPPSPPLYIGAGERGEAQPCPFLQGRVRPGGSPSPPRHLGGAFPLGDSYLPKFPWRMGLLGLVPLAHVGQGAPPTAHVAPRGRWPHPVGPRDPSGGPGTIPMTPKLVPMAETGLPIYKSLPPDHSGTPRDVRDLIRDSEQHLVTTYKLPLQP